MKKNLLKTLFVSAALTMGLTAQADEVNATLVHTASSFCSTDANAYTSTVDAEKEHVNNEAFNTQWQGAAYADFSFTLPEGTSVKKATLTFHIFGESRRDRPCNLYYANAGEQLDYNALAEGTAKVNLPGTKITDKLIFDKNGDNVEKTQDVSDAVKAIAAAGQGNIIFKWTGNPGGGDVAGKGSASAPVLVIETVSAASQTKYTVKFVDEDGNQIKDDATYDGTIGSEADAPAEDKANFYTADKTKKYIFVSSETITLVADASSNVITLTFRQAALYNYTVNFTAGELVLGSKSGTSFEGDEATVPYPKYLAADGQLYTKDATGKEYNYKFTPASDAEVKALEYTSKSEVTDVVYITEGEDIEGLTACTSNNTAIRSSNSGSAYATEDTKIVRLEAGTYKLHVIIYDATKEPNSHWIFKAGETQIADFYCTVTNIQEFDSEEFTLSEATDIILAANGNNNLGLDALYITGNGSAVVTGISSVNAVAEKAAIFNLAGQQVKKVTKGIYIINGKKTIVK